MWQNCPIKCTSISSKGENTVLQWAFKLLSAWATAENWHLEGHVLKVKECLIKGTITIDIKNVVM